MQSECWYSAAVLVHLCRQTEPSVPSGPSVTAMLTRVWLIHELATFTCHSVQEGKGLDGLMLSFASWLWPPWSSYSDNLSSDSLSSSQASSMSGTPAMGTNHLPLKALKKTKQNNCLCFDGKLLLTTKHSRTISGAPGTAATQVIHGNCSDIQLVGITATPEKSVGQNSVHIKNR